MFARMLDAAYLALALCASPLLIWRRLVQGKDRRGNAEKWLGRGDARTGNRPCLWLHAVSVGEVLQLRPVLEELERVRPDVELVLSTTTVTGHDVARDKYPRCRVVFFPLDFSWAVRAAFDRIRPTTVSLVELELWPNFLAEARRRGVPVGVVNGRLSERSHRGYGRLGFLARRMFGALAYAAAQSPEYARRFVSLGVPVDRVEVTGSIKFDRIEADRDNPRTAELRRSLGIAEGERVFIAGSTQDPEERLAIEAWRSLRDEFPDLRLVLVPRHKERFEEVAKLVRSEGLPLLRRSEVRQGRGTPDAARDLDAGPVLLLDTLGELAACWGLADVAFVGGSLTRRGGQNMIEPAAYGAAVLFGPNTWNFRDIVALLLDANAARVVRDGSELRDAVGTLLRDERTRLEMGRRARELVLAQQGATKRTVERIVAYLPAPDAARRAA
jgi:3-deoxy-D-manno-octulosonic-acid transferase